MKNNSKRHKEVDSADRERSETTVAKDKGEKGKARPTSPMRQGCQETHEMLCFFLRSAVAQCAVEQ